MDPARIFTESLTPRPELENSQGPKRTLRIPSNARTTSLGFRVCRQSDIVHGDT